MGVTFLTKLTDLKPKPGTAVIHRALAQGRGGSSLLVRLAPTRDAGPTIVTIEAQNY